MYSQDHNASPINPIPAVIVVIAVVVAGIELVFQGGEHGLIGGPQAISWRLEAMTYFGFLDPVFEHMRSTGDIQLEFLMRFITYPFIHFSLVHALFGVVLFLALGNFVGRAFPMTSVLAIFVIASFFGAISYGMFNETRVPLIGLYPAVYGLIGMYTWVLWMTARAKGENPIMAFRLIGVLVVLQLVFFAMSGQGNDLPSDGAGFLTGFILAPVLVKGGMSRLRNRLKGS